MAKTLLNTLLRKELNKVGNRYVKNLKASLLRRNINYENKLSNSVDYKVIIRSAADFQINIFWRSYGDVLNQGADDMGKISDGGFKRVQRWVEKKLGEPRYKRGKRGKRIQNSSKIAYAIVKSWRKRRFPSTKSRGIGWASTALRSRELADTKVAVATALQTAFNNFVKQKANEREKKLRRNRR